MSSLVKIQNRGTSSFFFPPSLQAIIPAAGGCLIFIDIGSGSGDVVVYSTVYCWWLFGTAESLVVRRRWTAACPPTLGRQQSLRLRMTARNQVLVPSLSLVRCVRYSLKRRRKEKKIHSTKFLLFILLYVCVCVCLFFYFVFVFSSSYVCHTHNLLVLCPLLMQWATRRSCLYAGRSGSAWYTLRPCIFLIYKYILIIQFRLVFVEWNVCLFAVAFQAVFSLFFFVSRGFVGKSGRWLMEKRRKKNTIIHLSCSWQS